MNLESYFFYYKIFVLCRAPIKIPSLISSVLCRALERAVPCSPVCLAVLMHRTCRAPDKIIFSLTSKC